LRELGPEKIQLGKNNPTIAVRIIARREAIMIARSPGLRFLFSSNTSKCCDGIFCASFLKTFIPSYRLKVNYL